MRSLVLVVAALVAVTTAYPSGKAYSGGPSRLAVAAPSISSYVGYTLPVTNIVAAPSQKGSVSVPAPAPLPVRVTAPASKSYTVSAPAPAVRVAYTVPAPTARVAPSHKSYSVNVPASVVVAPLSVYAVPPSVRARTTYDKSQTSYSTRPAAVGVYSNGGGGGGAYGYGGPVIVAPQRISYNYADPSAITSTRYHVQDQYGQYNYGYAQSDGQARTEVRGIDGTVAGRYSYFDPNGKHVIMSYVADEDGFRVAGNNLPQAPELPEELAREYEAAHSRLAAAKARAALDGDDDDDHDDGDHDDQGQQSVYVVSAPAPVSVPVSVAAPVPVQYVQPAVQYVQPAVQSAGYYVQQQVASSDDDGDDDDDNDGQYVHSVATGGASVAAAQPAVLYVQQQVQSVGDDADHDDDEDEHDDGQYRHNPNDAGYDTGKYVHDDTGDDDKEDDDGDDGKKEDHDGDNQGDNDGGNDGDNDNDGDQQQSTGTTYVFGTGVQTANVPATFSTYQASTSGVAVPAQVPLPSVSQIYSVVGTGAGISAVGTATSGHLKSSQVLGNQYYTVAQPQTVAVPHAKSAYSYTG